MSPLHITVIFSAASCWVDWNGGGNLRCGREDEDGGGKNGRKNNRPALLG